MPGFVWTVPKGDVTRDDSQQRFFAQTALQHCYDIVWNGSIVATLFCANINIVVANRIV